MHETLINDCSNFSLFMSICKTPHRHEVTVYEMTTWDTTGMLPPDVSALLDIIKLVQLREGAGPEGRIVVLSKYDIRSFDVKSIEFSVNPFLCFLNMFLSIIRHCMHDVTSQ